MRENGVKLWVVEERLKPGKEISEVIGSASEDADLIGVIIGNEVSPNMSHEIGSANARGKMVIRVILKSGVLPSDIQGLKYIDLRNNWQDGIQELINVIT